MLFKEIRNFQNNLKNFCPKSPKSGQWGAFYLFIADFFATQIIGGAKELVVLV